MDINTAVACLQSLRTFIGLKRDCFDEYQRQGIEKTGTSNYVLSHTRRVRRNVRLNPLDYGHAPEASLTPAEHFRTVSYLPVIDQLTTSLEHRISAYDTVQSRFAFLSRLDTLTTDEIRKFAAHLVLTYPVDLDSCTENEMIQFADLSKSFAHEQTNETSKELFFYRLIQTKGLRDTFLNVGIALPMYLVLMV